MRPKRSRAASMTRCAVSGSEMSPATVRISGSVAGRIDRDVATTEYPRTR
ncbi:MAG: hypothetical protein QOF86_1893 [Baekduia sp.]|jgi:hypothetical protein|nr:hypothetical protein [Baekduia sp.]